MAWKDREGNLVPGDEGQDRLLEWMYGTGCGRMLVRLMIQPWVSHMAGWMMDSPVSALAVKSFIRKNHIKMEDFEQRRFRSFNDFFTRHLREGARTVDLDPSHLVSPCDCKLSAYEIGEDSRFTIKGTEYTLGSLLRDEALAASFLGGTLLVFRLTVGDYHRYGYGDTGYVGKNVLIPGVYHTVNPAAAQRFPIYKENTRQYSLLESPVFGRLLQMEVGAAMVGRIVNTPGEKQVQRCQEKGFFAFGGSTIVLCLQKGAAVIDRDILENTKQDIETVVQFGQRIGCKE